MSVGTSHVAYNHKTTSHAANVGGEGGLRDEDVP